MTTRSTDVEVQSSEVLYRLYEVFDELGMAHRFSQELGECDIRIGDDWFTFYVDRRVLDDERRDEEAMLDSYRVAEMYWRQ